MSSVSRLWNAIRRARHDDDQRQEIEAHLAEIEAEERALGWTIEEARQRARLRFGSPLSYRDQAVDAVVATSVSDAGKEIIFAARRLRRSPAFTMATVLTLALAIGANAAIFAVVQRVVVNSLPYPDSEQLLDIDHGAQRLNLSSGMGMTRGLYYQYLERARSLESIAAYAFYDLTLTGDGDPERIRVARATTALAAVMRVSPALGRWFRDDEGVPGASAVAVLSHGLWVRRYGRDPNILGRSVTLGGVPTEVIGVMPASYAFPDPRVDVWIAEPIARSMGFGIWTYKGVARLRAGVTVADARAELNGLIGDLPRAFPGDLNAVGNGEQIKLFSNARTLKEMIVGDVARGLWILLVSLGLVLLIACANVANLFLVRSEARQREVAIRAALGAGRLGIARYFFAESFLLSIAGGVIGVALAWAAVRLLVTLGPATLPRLEQIRLDGVAVAYTFALSLLGAAAFGAIPLGRSALTVASLHEGGRGNTASPHRHRARHTLMAAEVALALVLLVASGLMVRSFQKLRALDPGFDPTSALTFSVGLPDRHYVDRQAAVAGHQALLDRLSTLPGVTAVSAATCLPLAGGCFGNTVVVEGRPGQPGSIPPIALFRAIAGGYFETMGIRLLRGRVIDRRDIERREPAVVVNDAFAKVFFPNQNPIGERVASNRAPARSGAPNLTFLTIVGVVANTPTLALAEPRPVPLLYMPMSIAGGPDFPVSSLVGPNISVMSYVVRSGTSVSGLMPSVRAAVSAVDPQLALAQVGTLQDTLDRASAQMAFTMVLLAVAAAVALMLGAIGIYGVISYVVTQRTAEIGVRLALGAEPAEVSRMIVRQGALVVVAGLAVGLAAALAGSRLIESLLFGVSPRDVGVFGSTTLLLIAIALLACWLPARRAAQLNPLDAIRMD
jgi:putative ABC transport system permease protein